MEKKNQNNLAKKFAEMQNLDDLTILLNDAKREMYGEVFKPIGKKQITYYANPKLATKRYNSFEISKKSGGKRVIHAPVFGLKSILRALNHVLQAVYEPSKSATGFVLGKSIVDNAKAHVGKNYVYNIDLKDFFHSFERKWVKYGFMMPPFKLGKEKEELAFTLASLCTHPFDMDGKTQIVLPQGSPTSPTITNILCAKLDKRLKGLADRFGATYTRYADDITFSSPHNIYIKDDFKNELKRIIEEDQGLKINPSKTRLQKKQYSQVVTGLKVNEKVNVTRRYIKELRKWLYLWERYGYDKGQKYFSSDYQADRGHVKSANAKLENVIGGKLEYLGMVKGHDNSTYKAFQNRYIKLVQKDDELDDILKLWEGEGINAAMHKYYGNHGELKTERISIDELFGEPNDNIDDLNSEQTNEIQKRFIDFLRGSREMNKGTDLEFNKNEAVVSTSIADIDKNFKALRSIENAVKNEYKNQIQAEKEGPSTENLPLDEPIIDLPDFEENHDKIMNEEIAAAERELDEMTKMAGEIVDNPSYEEENLDFDFDSDQFDSDKPNSESESDEDARDNFKL